MLGLEFGLYLWALMAAAGFAALVAVSEAAFVTLKVVGAAVLIYLGVRAWLAAWRGDGHDTDGAQASGTSSWWKSFAEGVVVQLANPKAAIFMVAFYPQFVPADRPLFTTTRGWHWCRSRSRPRSTCRSPTPSDGPGGSSAARGYVAASTRSRGRCWWGWASAWP